MMKEYYKKIELLEHDEEVLKMIKNLLEETEIKKFIKEENVTPVEFQKNLNTLLGYSIKLDKCKGCKNLNACEQNHQGYKPVLVKDEDIINIAYEKCSYMLGKNIDHLTLIGLNALDDENVIVNENRKQLLTLIQNYLIGDLTDQKGLYVYGNYGCGKTYIMLYLARKLADKGHNVFMGYYPEMVRLIKNAISNNGVSDIINYLKNVEVLIFDDFGGEVASSYIRDEIIGPILQERMAHKRLTFMTSNLDSELIQEHLAESNKDIDKTRASRLFERMRTLMIFVELADKNYRN